MKKGIKRIQKRRQYSEDFRRQVVKEYECGSYSVRELSRLYRISPQSIYTWIYKYSIFNKKGYRIVEGHQSSTLKLKELEHRIEELEGLLGRKQIKLEFLEKLIDLASEEFGVDIKKNYSSRHFNGSTTTEDR